MFGVVGSNLTIFKLEPTAPNMSYFAATGWRKKSTVRKKMATGTFTYNALRTKTLKEQKKHKEKIVNRHLFSYGGLRLTMLRYVALKCCDRLAGVYL